MEYSLKKKIKKICLHIAVILLIAVLIAAAVVTYDLLTNTYKTPIKTIEQLSNAKSIDFEKMKMLEYNNFAKKEYKELFKVMQTSEYFTKKSSAIESSFFETVFGKKTAYGYDYKITLKIVDKDELDKDELEEYEDYLNDQGKEALAFASDFTDSQWEQMSQQYGWTVSGCKKYIKALKAVAKKYKSAQVTEGYELTVEEVITGSELDSPRESEMTIYVYKVDGRWVASDALELFPL